MSRASILALVGLLLSCRSQTESTAGLPPVPQVEYSNCWAVYLPGPVCPLRPDPRLDLWVRTDPATRVEIRAGGRRLDVESEEVGDGRRFALSLPKEGSLLTVRLCQPDGPCGPPWSLTLAPPEVPLWFDELNRLQSVDPREARHRLELLRKTAPAREQGLILRQLAFLARLARDNAESAAYLKQGIVADRRERCVNGETEKTTWLARLAIEQGRFSEAQRLLEALRLPAGAPAGAKFQVAYYQGMLAYRIGDYRRALERLRQSAGLAERIGILQYRWKAEQLLAAVLQDLGRTQEAAGWFARLREDPHPETPCDLGDLLTNEAWSRLLAREGGARAEDPTLELEQAQAEFERNSCRPDQRLNAHLNLALAYLQAQRWSEARRELDQAQALGAEPSLTGRLWWDDLEARMAIVEGRPERALDLYETLERRAELALSPEGRLRASLGLAKTRLALGQRSAAIDALEEADRRIDEQSWWIPAHEGRDTFLAQREEPTRLYLQLLLEDGQRQRAFDLARRARSRLLHQLAVRDRLAQLTPDEQRKWVGLLSTYRELRDAVDRQAAQEWQLAGDEVERAREAQAAQLARARDALDRALASLGGPAASEDHGKTSLSVPAPGEVILAYHPLAGGRWAGFAATERGIEVTTFDLPPETAGEPEFSRILLEPFRSTLAASERVRVLSYGRLRSIDFHALPLAGEPLLVRHLVTYSLDLPVHPRPNPPDRGVALLVADPQGDLPEARKEAAVVAAEIRTWRPAWTLERLDGTAARAEAALRALPGSTLFHYAGHGRFGGFAGWDSSLPLADGSRLSLGDVLALRPAPAWVVLSSCDAGRSSEQAPGEGIGLANAFLLAGSRAVIAAPRPVADRTARELLRELYRGWRPGLDLPRQLQRAQLACRRTSPKADWASFRVLVP